MSQHDSEDRIFLRGLTTECIIGFIDWERRTPQTVAIDLEFPCDCERAARTDSVTATVDYKQVAKRVLAFVPETKFDLVETLAHRLALLLLAEFAFEWVRVTINKPGAIRYSSNVGVCIERRRSHLERARLEETGAATPDADGAA